jgi:4-carboxymuconolactone decarboxylase
MLAIYEFGSCRLAKFTTYLHDDVRGTFEWSAQLRNRNDHWQWQFAGTPDLARRRAALQPRPGRIQAMSNMGSRPAPGLAAFAAAALFAFSVPSPGLASLTGTPPPVQAPNPTKEIRMVAPALERYTKDILLGDLWKRPDLSPRDRSIVTVAVLVARNQPAELPFYLNRALDNGVKAAEISEIITHLAFYSGWPNAMAAVAVAKDVFAERKVAADQLPPATAELLALDKAAEERRASSVEQNFGKVAPGVVHYTTNVLFRELWLRPALAPRDRSLVTVSALVASGQVAQIPYHLNRAMDNGLTEAQASEVLTHLAFYAGWPNVFTALPVVKEVFSKRSEAGSHK